MSYSKQNYAKFLMPIGAGKSRNELLQSLSIPLAAPGVEEFGPHDPRRFLVDVKRQHLIENKFDQITAMFSSERTPEELRRVCGRIVYTTSGYDNDQREIYEIEYVRRFYRGLHAALPMWLFAGALDGAALLSVVLSIAPNAQIIRRNGAHAIEVRLPKYWLRQFFHDSLSVAAELHHRAEIAPEVGAVKLQQAAAYLGVN